MHEHGSLRIGYAPMQRVHCTPAAAPAVACAHAGAAEVLEPPPTTTHSPTLAHVKTTTRRAAFTLSASAFLTYGSLSLSLSSFHLAPMILATSPILASGFSFFTCGKGVCRPVSRQGQPGGACGLGSSLWSTPSQMAAIPSHSNHWAAQGRRSCCCPSQKRQSIRSKAPPPPTRPPEPCY